MSDYTSAKFTPGPWTIHRRQSTEDTHDHFIKAIAQDDGRQVDVCRVYPISDDGQPWGESAANARLIASAPELLEACRALVTMYADVAPYGQSPVVEAARAAIAKAITIGEDYEQI